MSWSNQQEQALAAIRQWLQRGKSSPQVFRVFGYAGTGKTTVAKEIAAMVNGSVLFAAFTGKAAMVLRSKGCDNASTIHSLIYKLDEDGPQPVFRLNPDSPLKMTRLLIVDEVSMVDEALGQDLLSFGTKVLVLGDPAQLPPVKGTGFFINDKPDVMLTEIHRQAADNPIIRMSMEIREGRRLDLGDYGDSRVIPRAKVGQKMVLAADQVLVGLNKTRRSHNAKIRQLLGRTNHMPEPGDRLVCLRNNKEKQLLNGQLWTVASADQKIYPDVVPMALAPEDAPKTEYKTRVMVPEQFFLGTEDTLEFRARRDFDEFDYGYALTTHKSQGSQWQNVMVFDESRAFREDADKWLYTAVTRAADRVTVVV